MAGAIGQAVSTPKVGRDIIHTLIVVSMFISTGDVFFVTHVAGLTVRLMQPLILLATLTYIFVKGNQRFILPDGFVLLVIFFALTSAFMPMYFWQRNLSYSFTFFFCILMVVLFVNYYSIAGNRMHKLLQWYIWSYVFVGSFGIVQFFAGLHGIDLLVAQWTVAGRLARVNGFSYEPSYFVLYNTCGWGMLLYLVVERVNILPRKIMVAALLITTVATLVSTSRSGIVMTYAMFMLFVVRCFFRARSGLHISRWFWLAAAGGVLAPVLGILYLVIKDPLIFQIMTNGLGVAGGSTHSVGPRLLATLQTINVAVRHPLIGTGLGGVGPAIADTVSPGLTFEQFMRSKSSGLNIFIEVFATGGVLGGLCMLLFFINLYVPAFNCRREKHDINKVNNAILFGLTMELLLLTMEPSLVRMHLWVDIAVVCAVNARVLMLHRRQNGPVARSAGGPVLSSD